MGENTESLCEAVAEYLSPRLGIRIDYVTDIPWQERERLFDAGEIQILWLCGLPYVHKADLPENGLELLAVPVPAGPRHGGRAVYFSDVVVRKESHFQTFGDLRGAVWAYNEPRSHSGYNVVRAYLSEFGEIQGFFGKIIESGTHQSSLEMVLSSQADAAAIDSTVLDWITFEQSKLSGQFRVIETLGPSPIPPWVIKKQVQKNIRRRLRTLLFQMVENPLGRSILKRGAIARFASSHDGDYNAIRRMALAAERVALQAS
jgi:phosphonate transport system substrate-binding protein